MYLCTYSSGSSSVGRAAASQAAGRGFETHFPLIYKVLILSRLALVLNGFFVAFLFSVETLVETSRVLAHTVAIEAQLPAWANHADNRLIIAA